LKAIPTGYVITKPPPTASAAPPQQPANRYTDQRPQVGNFDEHTWGISTSVITSVERVAGVAVGTVVLLLR
jgi:hypothetical protein